MKLYFDTAFRLDTAPTWLARPALGIPEEDRREIFAGIFDRFYELFPAEFQVVGSEKAADAVVVPHNWADYPVEMQRALMRSVTRRFQDGIPTILFYPAETDERIDWPRGLLVFRYNLYRSKRSPSEYPLPVWCNDFCACYDSLDFSLRRWKPRPSVGFCGYAPPLGIKLSGAKLRSTLRYFLYRLGMVPSLKISVGHAPRAAAILALRKSRQIMCRFLIRDFFAYGGQWGQLRPGGSFESARALRLEYAANMVSSDYALSVRGVTNTSIRCYEALSCGRIPLFVDTDCRLPGDFAFDWHFIMPWIRERDIPNIGKQLAEYHAALDETQFAELQKRCRQAYEQWIAPEGFFSRLADHLEHFRLNGGMN